MTDVEALDAALEGRERPELILLVKRLIQAEPQLQALVVGPGAMPSAASAEDYHRQAAAAFRGAGNQWGSSLEVARVLEQIWEAPRAALAQGDPAPAADALEALIAAVRECYADSHDEEGCLALFFGRALEDVRAALPGRGCDPAARSRFFQAMLVLYRYDQEAGGNGLADGVPALLEEQVRPEETQTVAGWVRELLHASPSAWARRHLGALLFRLEARRVDDEGFLALCRETGQRLDLIERLLQLGRVEEALAAAQAAGDPDLQALAELLAQEGHGPRAEQIVAALQDALDRAGR